MERKSVLGWTCDTGGETSKAAQRGVENTDSPNSTVAGSTSSRFPWKHKMNARPNLRRSHSRGNRCLTILNSLLVYQLPSWRQWRHGMRARSGFEGAFDSLSFGPSIQQTQRTLPPVRLVSYGGDWIRPGE